LFFVFRDAQLWEIYSGGVKDLSPVSSCIPKSVPALIIFQMTFQGIMKYAGEGLLEAPIDFCIEAFTAAPPGSRTLASFAAHAAVTP
jgi:hypothetical protein